MSPFARLRDAIVILTMFLATLVYPVTYVSHAFPNSFTALILAVILGWAWCGSVGTVTSRLRQLADDPPPCPHPNNAEGLLTTRARYTLASCFAATMCLPLSIARRISDTPFDTITPALIAALGIGAVWTLLLSQALKNLITRARAAAEKADSR
ncbi:hypothetical protein ABT352_33060 [Streptosporangium sp. NPDC000563]|uniref:hypothetical protein n=1 Tax=Streptosporangium sp. NPDC000563 TaxID=3154366 RepID=UPI00331F6A34